MTLISVNTPATCYKNWILWLGVGLILGSIAFWMMKKVSEDPYFLLESSQQKTIQVESK